MHCFLAREWRRMHLMDASAFHLGSWVRRLIWIGCSLLLIAGPDVALADAAPGAIAGFEAYRVNVEARLVAQHRSWSNPGRGFLAPCADSPAAVEGRLRRGDLIIERIALDEGAARRAASSGALLHHWRGTAFVPGMKVADFLKVMRDFDRYPQSFAPQIERARVLTHEGDRFDVSMRIRQKHVITVVMDTDYTIEFTQLDSTHGYSISHSTRVAEIASPGTGAEHALSASEEHGFLWRLNTYWSYEERDGGLYLQIEAVSLTRAIPTGLGWVIGPYVESIPRESMEFTLRSAANALRR
jgi:hypothetical protein